MRRTTLWSAGMMLAATVIFPRDAGAGVVEYIVGLSGPPMLGFPVGCEIALKPDPDQKSPGRWECLVVGLGSDRPDVFVDNPFRKATIVSLAIGGGPYVSTGRNANMKEVNFGSVVILALEPTLNVRSRRWGELMFHHGAGLSFFHVTGDDFKHFRKNGIKLVPGALTYKRFRAAYNLRIFPKAFTAAQFGAPAATTHEGREFVQSLTIGFLLWN